MLGGRPCSRNFKEFGWNVAVARTVAQRGPIYDSHDSYAPYDDPDHKNSGDLHWPTAGECFWECTHPVQWPLRQYIDIKEYSPFYDDIPSRKNKYRKNMFHETGLIAFYRGKNDCSLPRPGHSRSHGVFPGIFPTDGFYDTMETWEEALSPEYRRTSDHPEVGFHEVFGEVNSMWYIEFYMQLRRKLQVQRQIRLLIFDVPDHIFGCADLDEYEMSWKFIVPYTDAYHIATSTFCGLWINRPLEHLTCHMKTQDTECFDQLECSKYLYYPSYTIMRENFHGIYEIPLPMRKVSHKWLNKYDVGIVKWNKNVRDFMIQMQYDPMPLHS